MKITFSHKESKIMRYLINSIWPTICIFGLINLGFTFLSLFGTWPEPTIIKQNLSKILFYYCLIFASIFLFVFTIIAKNDNGISLREIFYKRKQ